MARTLHDFLNAHTGETAWLFGKGPSLDRFDMASAGPLRCAINDVARDVPGCRYAFANDSVRDWAHVYRAGQVLFQPHRLGHDPAAAHCPTAAERVVFADEAGDERLAWPRERLAREGLALRRGTLGSAEQILHVMGVRRIVCVGIDGGGAHAARAWHTVLRHDHAADYNAIRSHFIAAAHAHGIAVEFHGADLHHQLANGMRTIRILETCLVAGQHVEAGQVIEQPPHIADELIGSGRAVAWSVIAPDPALEAAAVIPGTEHATARRAARPRREAATA